MALPPQKFREMVFQILFSQELDVSSLEETALMLMKELKVTKKAAFLACEKVKKIREKQKDLDQIISSSLTEYSLDRVAKAELAILRLAFFEILFDDEIPYLVAIAEAMRLAKKFSTPSSVQFINAVLDAGYKQSCI